MGSIPNQFPISLRAWPSSQANGSNLGNMIRRINLERGGFREISEESLRQEITEAEAEVATPAGQDEPSDEDDAEEDKPHRMKELMTARDELLGQIE